MFCSKCGLTLNAGDTVCKTCGQPNDNVQNAQQTQNFNNQTTPYTHYSQPQQVGGAGMAIASMVLGIISLVGFCAWYVAIPCAIVGIILGLVSLSRKARGRGMAIAGVVTGAVGIALAIIIVIWVFVFVTSIPWMDWM